MSYAHISLLVLRLSLGWMMFYAGITKVLNPEWSAAGYLNGAQTFGDFYAVLTAPQVLPFVNFLNEWGLTLLGLSLIFGVFVRLSAPLGAILMMLYYFPVLTFPYVGEHSYIVDDHVISAAALLVLAAYNAGHIYGMDSRMSLKRILGWR